MATNTKKKISRRARHRQIVRRRRIALGVFVVVAVLLLYVIIHSLYIKFKPKADVSTLTIKEDGVKLEEVIDTDELKASNGDLKRAVKDDISAFNSKHGKNAARFIRLGEKNGKCYVETAFKDVETYAKYSGYAVKLTKVKASKANFDAIFSEVKDGKKSGYIDAYKVKKMKGQLLVLNENITVKVPGDVKCVSDEGTKVNEDGSVTIKPVNGNNDYAVNTYIIFE